MIDVATAAPMFGAVRVGDTSRTIAPVPVVVLPSIVVFASYACTVDQITNQSNAQTAAEFAAATIERPKDVKSASAAVPAPVKYATLSAAEVNHAMADKLAFWACTSVPITRPKFDLAVTTLVRSLRLALFSILRDRAATRSAWSANTPIISPRCTAVDAVAGNVTLICGWSNATFMSVIGSSDYCKL